MTKAIPVWIEDGEAGSCNESQPFCSNGIALTHEHFEKICEACFKAGASGDMICRDYGKYNYEHEYETFSDFKQSEGFKKLMGEM